MTIGCNIWMICLKLNWFFYDPSRMFQLPQFVWALRSSVWDVFINFLLLDATDRSKISSDQKRFFIALSLYPLSFFANTPFKVRTISWSLYQVRTISRSFYQFRTLSRRIYQVRTISRSLYQFEKYIYMSICISV